MKEKVSFIGKCLLIETNEKRILVIGDLHLGYEESLNVEGVFVFGQMFDEYLKYLDMVFEKTGKVDYIVLLGDVKHNFGTIMKQERTDIFYFFNYLEKKCEKIIIAKGNHDSILEFAFGRKENIELKDFFVFGEFCFMHGDKEFSEMNDKKVKYWILGHGHPAVKISDGIKIEKYKCFLVGEHKRKDVIIMPSFIEANEGSDPRENDLGMAWDFNYGNFEVFVVQDESLNVLKFGKLKRLN